MKKRRVVKIILCMLLCTMTIALVGCKKDKIEDAKTEETGSSDSVKNDIDTDEDKTDNNTEKETEDKTEDVVEEPIVEKKDLVLVVPTADGTTFEEVSVKVDEITPDVIISELIKYGILAEDVSVLGLTDSESNGEKLLDLNLNQAFQNMLMQQGSNGEEYTLGSVCNTFLKAYGAAKIKVQVEGQPLETGHNTYDMYMSMFVK